MIRFTSRRLPSTLVRPFELGFGDLRDRLVAAVVAGDKTVTTSLRVSYELEHEPLPQPGLHALVDRDDNRVGVVDVESVEVRRLAEIDDSVAHGEGEGFADVAHWLAARALLALQR